MNAAEHASMLRALLPQGKAWDAEPGTAFADTLLVLGQEPARVDARAVDLQKEADPRTTVECIDEWEASVGLPGDCAAPLTLDGRRAAVVAKLTDSEGARPPHIEDVAALLGYTIAIVEYCLRPPTCIGACNDYLYGEGWQPATCNSNCDDPLFAEQWLWVWDVHTTSGSDDALLECLIKDMEPPHTLCRVFFT